MTKFLFGDTTHLKDPKLRKMHGNRKFHILFWFMIYVALKFTLSEPEIEF